MVCLVRICVCVCISYLKNSAPSACLIISARVVGYTGLTFMCLFHSQRCTRREKDRKVTKRNSAYEAITDYVWVIHGQ